MKLAISIAGQTLDSPFDARFGRAASFCLVDTDSGAWTVHANPGLSASGGAGVQAAQFVAGLGAQAVVSGAYGPKAYDTLAAANIQRLLAPGDAACRAADILAAFQAGPLAEADGATHGGHHGG
ncbi:NifB/NifX family molybdenum-iron cluster-binding protein [Thiocystis violacea]|uniref:NifB/NifX family molybdenum-iron cluster-binding protein n=1 Tax=Thiocystis violacea TaxID=13725 RepID=UPI001908884C|nr:NifB/NifX family molybdenum-iron cluster-binding protein [Thiocystis violacea]MBK1717362.1 dinitrogenase iron-molybdenum cofactor biosynthesis protein [Thiocystis violacea]